MKRLFEENEKNKNSKNQSSKGRADGKSQSSAPAEALPDNKQSKREVLDIVPVHIPEHVEELIQVSQGLEGVLHSQDSELEGEEKVGPPQESVTRMLVAGSGEISLERRAFQQHGEKEGVMGHKVSSRRGWAPR